MTEKEGPMSTKLTATGIRRRAEDRQHDESSALHSCSCTAWECFEEIVLLCYASDPCAGWSQHGLLSCSQATICEYVYVYVVTLWVCAAWDGSDVT